MFERDQTNDFCTVQGRFLPSAPLDNERGYAFEEQHIANKTQTHKMNTNSVTNKPTENSIVSEFLKHNAAQSALFSSPDERFQRQRYRAKLPTEVVVLKCMDGRLNFALMTETPFGIVQSFRNVGGRFNIGGHFGKLLESLVKYAVRNDRDVIVLVTYHWSKGSLHRGCKGFNYNQENAMAYTKKLLGDIEQVFGKKHLVVHPIQVGIETDEDALVLHGSNGKILDLAEVKTDESAGMRTALATLFPDMKPGMIESLLPYCLGNIRHIAKIRESNRPLANIDHQEVILGVGRGFDWHHIPNTMFIVDPDDYHLIAAIATAGRILLDNIRTGRIPKDRGVALITSAVYGDEIGSEPERVRLEADSLAHLAFETLARDVPDLIPHLTIAAGILNQNTRLFTTIELSDDLGAKLIEQQQSLLQMQGK